MSNKNKRTEYIDVKGALKGYLKRWYWFLLSLIFCGACAYVFTKINPQKSRVESSILVTQDDNTANLLNGLGGLFGADPYVQDEVFVITSHEVLKTVAKNLSINKIHIVKTGFLTKKMEYPDFPVDVYADPQIVDTLASTLNFKVVVAPGGGRADIRVKVKREVVADLKGAVLPATVKTEYGTYIVNKTDKYPDKEPLTTWISFTGYDSAAEDITEDLDTWIASKKSNVIELGITTSNAEYGCDILNDIMKVYNERGIAERNQRAMKTAAFLAERLEMITAALNDAEGQIETYKEGQNIVDVAAEAALNAQVKTEAEKELVTLETQQEILNMTLDFLSKPDNKYELMPVASKDLGVAESAIETYNELVIQYMTLSSGAMPGNREIEELEKQIDAMRANIVVAIDRLAKNNQVAVNDMKAQINMVDTKLGKVPNQEREYRVLLRQQEVKQQLYLFLLERSEETAMLIANAIPKGQIIDPAYVLRDPVGAGKMVILLIAVVIGLFIPVVFIYLSNLTRSKIDGRADVERQTALPILGEMCVDKSGKKLVVGSDKVSSSAELFRMLRSNLQFVLGNPDDKAVMITSSQSGEGKSFISTNLAASLALLGRKVVLVGLDIRKPQLANYLGVAPTPGLTQYLSNSSMKLDEIIRPYKEVPGMDLIVAGPIPPNPGELMTSPRIAQMMDQLRKDYDYIILDTAPVGMVSDSFNLTQYVDATVYVVRDKYTRLQDIRFLNNITEEGKLKRTNIVVNGTKSTKGYGYGYK